MLIGTTKAIQYSISGTQTFFLSLGQYDQNTAYLLAAMFSGTPLAIQFTGRIANVVADLKGKQASRLIKPLTIFGTCLFMAISSYTIIKGSNNQLLEQTITKQKQGELYKSIAAKPQNIQAEIAAIVTAINTAQSKKSSTQTMNCNPKYKSCRKAKLELSRTQSKAGKQGISTLKILQASKERAERKLSNAERELKDKNREIKELAQAEVSNKKYDNIGSGILPDLFANLLFSITLFLLGAIPLIFKKIHILQLDDSELQLNDSAMTADDNSELQCKLQTPAEAENQFRDDITKGKAELSVRKVKANYSGKVTPTAREEILLEMFNKKHLNRKQDARGKFHYGYPTENLEGGKTQWHPNHYLQQQNQQIVKAA